MGAGRGGSDHQKAEGWEHGDRNSFRIALAIALLPIPISLLIAWALGDLPWRRRPERERDRGAQVAPEQPDSPVGHGHP